MKGSQIDHPEKTTLKNPSLIIIRIKKLSSPTQVFVEDESVTFLINSKLIHQWSPSQQQKALSMSPKHVLPKCLLKMYFKTCPLLSNVCTQKSVNYQIKT